MPIKNQPSILMNKKSCEMGKPSAPRKGRFVVHRGVDPRICMSLYSIYAYKISSFYLDKQISFEKGSLRPPHGPRRGPYKLQPTYMHIILLQYAYQISAFCLDKKVGASAQRKGHFAALSGADSNNCISLYFILYEQYAYQLSTFCLDK